MALEKHWGLLYHFPQEEIKSKVLIRYITHDGFFLHLFYSLFIFFNKSVMKKNGVRFWKMFIGFQAHSFAFCIQFFLLFFFLPPCSGQFKKVIVKPIPEFIIQKKLSQSLKPWLFKIYFFADYRKCPVRKITVRPGVFFQKIFSNWHSPPAEVAWIILLLYKYSFLWWQDLLHQQNSSYNNTYHDF